MATGKKKKKERERERERERDGYCSGHSFNNSLRCPVSKYFALFTISICCLQLVVLRTINFWSNQYIIGG